MDEVPGADETQADIGDRLSALLNEVEARLEEGFADEALVLAEQSRRLLDRNPGIATDLQIDTHYLLASCSFEQRDVAAALRSYEKVRELDAEDPEIDYWQARALFHLWRFDEAAAHLRRLRPNNHTRAGSLYYRALTSDFLGDTGSADELFRRAEMEDPGEFPMPLRLPTQEVWSMVEDLLRSLPSDVRLAIEHVGVEMNPLPDPQVHAGPGMDPLVLGLCKRRGEACRGPRRTAFERDGIEVFQRNMERVSSDREEFADELRNTILHEIGHHLGEAGGRAPLPRRPLN